MVIFFGPFVLIYLVIRFRSNDPVSHIMERPVRFSQLKIDLNFLLKKTGAGSNLNTTLKSLCLTRSWNEFRLSVRDHS